MPYRQNQEIEIYKADQLYKAKVAELQGDRYRADMHYKAAVDAARIQAQAQNYKTDKETGFKEKELKANKAAQEWSDYGTFLDKQNTNRNTREGHLIRGIGAVAKLQGDRRIPGPNAQAFEDDLNRATIVGDNGKPRKLTDTEKQQRRLAFLSRQSGGTDNLLEMLTGALGNSLGGQQRAIPSVQGTLSSTPQVQAGNTATNASSQAVGGASATSTTSREPELGQPIKQPSLAPGQNWLNPTAPQDRSVPPQGLPYTPNTPEDRVLDQFIKAGISPAQAPYAVQEFKEKGVEGVTNPTSATHEDLIAKLHGQQPLRMTPEMGDRFRDFLDREYGVNYDTFAYKEAKKRFMADPRNWQTDPKKEALIQAYKQKLAEDTNVDYRDLINQGRAIELRSDGTPLPLPDKPKPYKMPQSMWNRTGPYEEDQPEPSPYWSEGQNEMQFTSPAIPDFFDRAREPIAKFFYNVRHPIEFIESMRQPVQMPQQQPSSQQAVQPQRQQPLMPAQTGLSVPFIPREDVPYQYESGNAWDKNTMDDYLRLVQGY